MKLPIVSPVLGLFTAAREIAELKARSCGNCRHGCSNWPDERYEEMAADLADLGLPPPKRSHLLCQRIGNGQDLALKEVAAAPAYVATEGVGADCGLLVSPTFCCSLWAAKSESSEPPGMGGVA